MGISVKQWRASIGYFRQKLILYQAICGSTGCSRLLVCIIAVLLLIGGIECYPGPTMTELAKKLDDFIASYHVTRDQMLLPVPALSSKLDDIVKELLMLIKATSETVKQLDTRLATLELLQSTNPSAPRVKNVADSEPIGNQGSMPCGASDI